MSLFDAIASADPIGVVSHWRAQLRTVQSTGEREIQRYRERSGVITSVRSMLSGRMFSHTFFTYARSMRRTPYSRRESGL